MEDQNELFNFIEKKKLQLKTFNYKKILFLSNLILFECLSSIYNKFFNLDYALHFLDTIFIIFWTIYNYSHNLKLSMFLCERASKLYNEYISLSSSLEDSNILLKDIKLFIYKKTLGPLTLKFNENENEINYIYKINESFKESIKKILLIKKNLKDVDYFLDNINIIDNNDIKYFSEITELIYSIRYNNNIKEEILKLKLKILLLKKKNKVALMKTELMKKYSEIDNLNHLNELNFKIVSNKILNF